MADKKPVVTAVSPEQKVTEIAVDIKKFEKKQVAVAVITNDKELTEATNFLIEVKNRINRIKAISTEYVAPLKEDLDSLKNNIKKLEGLFDAPRVSYEQMETAIKRAISDYRMKLENDARAEEKRLRDIQAEEDRKAKEKHDKDVAKAEKAGKPTPPPAPVAVAPLATVERKEKTMANDTGSATARKVIKFEITDHTKLPKKIKDLILMKANEKELDRMIVKKFVDMGGIQTEIEGVRVYEDFDISVKA